MTTFTIYYLETNLLCMLIMVVILYFYVRDSKGLAEAKWFIASCIGVLFYCLSDIFAAVFKNQTFTGARAVLQVSNTLYIAMPLILTVLWQRYVVDRMRRYNVYGRRSKVVNGAILGLSLAICLMALSSPVTHFSFYLDEMNGYHRSLGAYAVPVFSYVFLGAEWVKARLVMRRSKELEVRTEARALALLPIPCLFFSLLQVVYYGITTAQVGFTLGYMIVFLRHQQDSISNDELTGLNNRRQLEYAIDHLSRSGGSAFVAMIDVDGFKKVNDTLGHVEGDMVLKSVATLLYRVCESGKLDGDFNVYRYGGDEFTILSSDFEPDSALCEKVRNLVGEAVAVWNSRNAGAFTMSLSVGSAFGRLSEENIHELIARADKQMYQEKSDKNALR